MFESSRPWIRWSSGRPRYGGRVTRAPFAAWADGAGQDAITRAASEIGFTLLGKRAAVRRRFWKEVSALGRDAAIAAEVQNEIDTYLGRLSVLAFCDGLPRAGVELHRLVVVPVVLLNAAAYQGLATRLYAQPAFRALSCDALREFFLLTAVNHLESAVAGARPTAGRPLAAGRGWLSVGMNKTFVWRVPFEAPDWAGHHYVFELTREAITRATRRAIDDKIRAFEASLGSLSKAERSDILRRATAA